MSKKSKEWLDMWERQQREKAASVANVNRQWYTKTSQSKYSVGTPVLINGPHDKYGIVASVEITEKGFKHTIRGTGSKKPEGTPINFDRM